LRRFLRASLLWLRSRRGAAYSWALVMALGSFVAYPAFRYPVEEHAHDAATFHVFRAVVFSDALSEGGLYPRWVQAANGGLGGPLFSFYSPLSYWPVEGLHRLGVGQPAAWRPLVGLAVLVGCGGAFALGLALFRRADAAIVGAVRFTYAPAFLRDLFDRGSPEGLAESLPRESERRSPCIGRRQGPWRMTGTASCICSVPGSILLPGTACFPWCHRLAARSQPRTLTRC